MYISKRVENVHLETYKKFNSEAPGTPKAGPIQMILVSLDSFPSF